LSFSDGISEIRNAICGMRETNLKKRRESNQKGRDGEAVLMMAAVEGLSRTWTALGITEKWRS
jgi:hypothetical protein